MKLRVWFATGLFLVLCTTAFAADPPKAKEMTPEQNAAMDMMMKAMSPNEHHRLLDPMIGSWDAKVTTWMAPGADPMVNAASSTAAWALDGRVVEEHFNGTFMGAPFTGLGYTGYDNVKKTYWNTWMDSMSTGTMTSNGTTTDDGKTWKYTAKMTDPMSGKEGPVEMRIAVTDRDHHSMEMWAPGPDGKMFKMMVIDYTRKK